MKLNLQKTEERITKRLQEVISRAKSPRAYLNTVIYRKYQLAQIARWQSAGSGATDVTTSEGDRWPALSDTYFERKAIDAARAGWPYAGEQFLVREGTLLQAVVGTDLEYHRKIVDDFSIEIDVTLPYAQYVAEGTGKMPARSFMTFSPETEADMVRGVMNYLKTGSFT